MTQEFQLDSEEALVRAFVVPAKQQRLLELLANPKRRRDALRTLAHFRDLDTRYTVAITPGQQSAAGISGILRARGAPAACYLVSESADFDGRTMALSDALDAVVGAGYGTLVSCIPGRLGYYEGEGPSDRRVLSHGA